MARNEDMVEVINTLRREVKDTASRLAKTEGSLATANDAFAATEKKLRALGYDPRADVAAKMQKKLQGIKDTLADARKKLDDAEGTLADLL